MWFYHSSFVLFNRSNISRKMEIQKAKSCIQRHTSFYILLPIDLTNQAAIIHIPKLQESSYCATTQLIAIRTECYANNISSTLKSLWCRVTFIQIPNFYGAIPTCTSLKFHSPCQYCDIRTNLQLHQITHQRSSNRMEC